MCCFAVLQDPGEDEGGNLIKPVFQQHLPPNAKVMLLADIGECCNTVRVMLLKDIGESCNNARVMLLADIGEFCNTVRVMLLKDIGEFCNTVSHASSRHR